MTSLTPFIWYRFESWTPGSTTIINEGSSGSTNDGVLTNSAIVISSDYAVGAHSLMVGNRGSSGAYSYLSISGSIDLSSDFTICFWNKYKGTWNDGDVLFYIGNGAMNFSLITYNTYGILMLKSNGYNSINVQFPTPNTISGYTWHHYAVVSDSINKTYYIYLDGVQLLTQSNLISTYNINNNTVNNLGTASA